MLNKNNSNKFVAGIAVLTLLSLLPVAGNGAEGSHEWRPDLKGNIITIISTSKLNDSITLLVWGKDKPVKTVIQPKTLLECICYHCNMIMSFSLDISPSRCLMCPCDASNSECTTGLSMKKKGSFDTLSSLPKGTQMRAVWEETGNPESNLLRLIVDRKSILLPVDIDCSSLLSQLSEAIKPMGGSQLEIGNSGKLLRITWSEDWTPARSAKLEKILAKWNIHIAFLKETSSR